jgi:predicted permease
METILAAVVPVMVVTLIGFVLARCGKPVEGESLRFVITQIGSPILIFTALQKTSFSGALLASYAGAAAVAVAAFGAIGYLVLRAFRVSIRAFLPSMMFGNTGNLGLPLSLYAFGAAGLGHAAVVHTVAAVGNFTIGQSIAMGKANFKALVTHPALIAAVLGVLAAVSHTTLPRWLHNTLELVANLSIPLMVLMLGTSLATIRVTALRRALWLSALRIGMGMAVGFAVAWAFDLSGVARAVLVLQCSMPAAVFNYLFAMVSRTDPEGVAGVVVVSTLVSVVTIPALLAILL